MDQAVLGIDRSGRAGQLRDGLDDAKRLLEGNPGLPLVSGSNVIGAARQPLRPVGMQKGQSRGERRLPATLSNLKIDRPDQAGTVLVGRTVDRPHDPLEGRVQLERTIRQR